TTPWPKARSGDRAITWGWDGASDPSLGPLAHVEFQLPALLAVAAQTPQLQSPDLRHLAVQVDRHRLPFVAGRLQGRRQGRELVDLSFPVFDQRADGIAPPNGRAEEAELRRLADY